MPLNFIKAVTLRTAGNAFVGIPVEKLDGNEFLRMQCRYKKKSTYSLNEVEPCLATSLLRVFGETQGVFGNAVRESRVRSAPEWPAPKNKLIGTDTK
jgi:hypothetical protein